MLKKKGKIRNFATIYGAQVKIHKGTQNVIMNMIPHKERPPFRDFENLIYKSSSLCVYMITWHQFGHPINLVLSKLAVDNDILFAPPVEDDSEPTFDILAYTQVLPTHGLLYACTNGRLIDLNRRTLTSVWNKLFKINTLYEVLLGRYNSHLQPLIEYHQSLSKSKKTFEIMQHRFFCRVTDHTFSLVGINLIFLSHIIRMGWKQIRTPKLVFAQRN